MFFRAKSMRLSVPLACVGLLATLPLAGAPATAQQIGQQRLFSKPRPPEITVKTTEDIDSAVTYGSNSINGPLRARNGARWIQAAQIGLMFGSPEGRDYLAAQSGRAMAIGEPAESCPVVITATSTQNADAARLALNTCLSEIYGRPDCACRLSAMGDVLLAKRSDFTYALGVTARILDLSRGTEHVVVAEERRIPEAEGSRRIWLLGLTDAVAMLQTSSDGRVVFQSTDSEKKYHGTVVEDGLRRGRIARRAYLTDALGNRMIVLVGYEKAEFDENRDSLTAWNPDGIYIRQTAEKDD